MQPLRDNEAAIERQSGSPRVHRIASVTGATQFSGQKIIFGPLMCTALRVICALRKGFVEASFADYAPRRTAEREPTLVWPFTPELNNRLTHLKLTNPRPDGVRGDGPALRHLVLRSDLLLRRRRGEQPHEHSQHPDLTS